MDLTPPISQLLEQSLPLLEALTVQHYFIYSTVFLSPQSLKSRLSCDLPSSSGIFLVCLTQKPHVSHSFIHVCWCSGVSKLGGLLPQSQLSSGHPRSSVREVTAKGSRRETSSQSGGLGNRH